MVLDSGEKKIVKGMVFPPEFSKKVDTEKVNREVIKQWMAGRWKELAKAKDADDIEIEVEYAWNTLTTERFPDPKEFQLRITGFLEKGAPKIARELWELLLSAQDNPNGVPPQLLEAKKNEILQQKIEKEKRELEDRQRTNRELERDQDTDRRRRGGRDDRGRGRGDIRRHDRHGSDSRREDRSYGRQDFRDSRRSGRDDRRRSRSPARLDSYVPSSRRRERDSNRRLSRSPPRRMRSPSPPRRASYSDASRPTSSHSETR